MRKKLCVGAVVSLNSLDSLVVIDPSSDEMTSHLKRFKNAPNPRFIGKDEKGAPVFLYIAKYNFAYSGPNDVWVFEQRGGNFCGFKCYGDDAIAAGEDFLRKPAKPAVKTKKAIEAHPQLAFAF